MEEELKLKDERIKELEGEVESLNKQLNESDLDMETICSYAEDIQRAMETVENAVTNIIDLAK